MPSILSHHVLQLWVRLHHGLVLCDVILHLSLRPGACVRDEDRVGTGQGVGDMKDDEASALACGLIRSMVMWEWAQFGIGGNGALFELNLGAVSICVKSWGSYTAEEAAMCM